MTFTIMSSLTSPTQRGNSIQIGFVRESSPVYPDVRKRRAHRTLHMGVAVTDGNRKKSRDAGTGPEVFRRRAAGPPGAAGATKHAPTHPGLRTGLNYSVQISMPDQSSAGQLRFEYVGIHAILG